MIHDSVKMTLTRKARYKIQTPFWNRDMMTVPWISKASNFFNSGQEPITRKLLAQVNSDQATRKSTGSRMQAFNLLKMMNEDQNLNVHSFIFPYELYLWLWLYVVTFLQGCLYCCLRRIYCSFPLHRANLWKNLRRLEEILLGACNRRSHTRPYKATFSGRWFVKCFYLRV